MRSRSIRSTLFLLICVPVVLAAQEQTDTLSAGIAPEVGNTDSTSALPADLAPLKRFYGPAWRYLPALNMALFAFDTSIAPRRPQKVETTDALVTSGTLFRGLTVSSGQGALLSGGLDLQVQGILAGDVFLQATLTDRNLPIQPEGNTRALEELDQVKLALSGPWGDITAGDFILRGGGGPLTSFSRKLEGMTAQLSAPRSSWKLRGAVAGSKGRFRSQSMSGVTGRQGPYRLSAEDGSETLVVLAGTENVWLDGIELERGDRFDYTIDYQTGELFFTPRNAIYSDSRITVDFEYSSLVYSQTTGFVEGSWQSPRSNLVLSAYSRTDDPASALAFSLSPRDRELLRQSTGADTALITSGATADSTGGYDLLDGHYIWVGEGQGSYDVAFHRVGSAGNYRRVVEGNRLIYEWVSGDSDDAVYAPYRRLVAPTSHRVVAARYEYRGKEQGRRLSIETAMSRYDLNRLSIVSSGPRSAGGYAAHGAWQSGNGRNWVASFDVKAQGKGAQFQPLGRWDEVEMAREWDLDQEPMGYSWYTAQGRLASAGGQAISAEGGQLNGGSSLTNRMRWSYTKSAVKGLGITLRQSRTSGGYYSRIKSISDGSIKYNFKYLAPFVDYLEEDRSGPDSLGFKVTRLHAGTALKVSDVQWRIGREQRAERYAGGNREDADLWRVAVKTGKKRWGQLESDIAFNRQKSSGAASSSADYFLGTITYRRRSPGTPWWIDLRHRIERTASESRAVLYDSVGAGLGRFRYDSAYDTFVPDEAGDYIRRIVTAGPATPLVAAISRVTGQVTFNRFAWAPATLKKWVEARVAWQANLESHSRTQNAPLIGPVSIDDERALFFRGRTRLEGSLQRRRKGPRYSVRYNTTDNLIDLRSSGPSQPEPVVDTRRVRMFEFQRSQTLERSTRDITLDTRVNSGSKTTHSVVYPTRNMSISSVGFEGTMGTILATSFANGGALSGSITGRWMRETSATLEKLSADLYGATLGLAQQVGKTGRLRLDWELLEVLVNMDTDLPLAMAEGLPAGLSSRVRFSGQVPLAANLIMTISFFSRNPEGEKAVRTANLELRTRL